MGRLAMQAPEGLPESSPRKGALRGIPLREAAQKLREIIERSRYILGV